LLYLREKTRIGYQKFTSARVLDNSLIHKHNKKLVKKPSVSPPAFSRIRYEKIGQKTVVFNEKLIGFFKNSRTFLLLKNRAFPLLISPEITDKNR